MTDEELGFEAYVVLGNALHLLVNGVSTEDQQRLGLPMHTLQRLHTWLEPVRANEMLGALRRLSFEDRVLLAESLVLSGRIAGDRVEELLGAPGSTRDLVVTFLRTNMEGEGSQA